MLAASSTVLWLAGLVLSAVPPAPTASVEKSYTIQILSVSAKNQRALVATYDRLRQKGYLVYHYRQRLRGRWYRRLRQGVFETASVARKYAAEIRRKEGFHPFVTALDAQVTMSRYADRFRIVTAPSGIWLQSGTSVKQIYEPGPTELEPQSAGLQISPDGTAVAFYHAGRIIQVTLGTGESRILKQADRDNELLNPVLRWSPDGQYLAYLDAPEWELPTRLWVMRSDGSDDHCLIGDTTGQRKVKSFLWHPRKNTLFCVYGPTHGTVSVGGDLLYLDLTGNRQVLVAADPQRRTEVHRDFRTVGSVLYYTVTRFRPDGRVQESTRHGCSIATAQPLAQRRSP